MKKNLKGTMTIEAAVIVPLIMGMFMLIIFILFYYHDKNVISAIAHETLVITCDKEEISSEEIETFFQERMQGKLILFPQVHAEISVEDDVIHMIGTARKNGMSLRVEMKMKKTEPEKYIRNIRRIGVIK